MDGKIVIDIAKYIGGALGKRWHALLDPDTTIANQRLEVLSKAFDVAGKKSSMSREYIDWQIQKYEQMGLSKEDIKEKLLPRIEKGEDPFSVLDQLYAKGAVTNFKLLEEGEEIEDDDEDPDILLPKTRG